MGGLLKVSALNFKMGQRLKTIRELHGITQVNLAKKLKITRTSLTNMEAGRQNFAVYNLVAFSKALGIPLGRLFNFLIK